MPPQTPSFVPPSPLPPLQGTSSAAAGPEGTFTETAKQIFARLNERKYLLLQRALLAVWPGLLTIAAAYAFWGSAVDNQENGLDLIVASVSARPMEGWIIGAMVLFSILYGVIASAVLSIERIIWVDSYFDGKNLSPQESLRVARRLLPSAVRFWVWSWFRFWLLPLAASIGAIALSVAVGAGAFGGGDEAILWAIGIGCATFGGVVIWSFYLSIRLRNLWFLFLDHHDGDRVDTEKMVEEMDRINRETKTKEFLKYIGSVAGVDTVTGLTKLVLSLGAQASGASKFLDRTLAGQGVKMYGQALAAQAQSFARAIAAYVFYRAARARLGIGQAVNEKVYALAKE
jgi:hypothetical protein